MTDSIHHRIRQARLAKGLKQRQIAEAIGVTTQAVNQWEKTTEPSNDHLGTLAALLGVSADYLLRGDKAVHDQAVINLLLALDKGTERDVPLVELYEMTKPSDLASDRIKQSGRKPVRARYEVSDRAFAFIMPDESMHPEVIQGDTVVIDHSIHVSPGEYVVAYIKSENKTVFLRFRFDGSQHCVLEPVNTNYRTYRFSLDEWSADVTIIGVMTEFTRRTRGRIYRK